MAQIRELESASARREQLHRSELQGTQAQIAQLNADLAAERQRRAAAEAECQQLRDQVGQQVERLSDQKQAHQGSQAKLEALELEYKLTQQEASRGVESIQA